MAASRAMQASHQPCQMPKAKLAMVRVAALAAREKLRAGEFCLPVASNRRKRKIEGESRPNRAKFQPDLQEKIMRVQGRHIVAQWQEAGRQIAGRYNPRSFQTKALQRPVQDALGGEMPDLDAVAERKLQAGFGRPSPQSFIASPSGMAIAKPMALMSDRQYAIKLPRP